MYTIIACIIGSSLIVLGFGYITKWLIMSFLLQGNHVALWLNIEFDNEINPFTSENFPNIASQIH